MLRAKLSIAIAVLLATVLTLAATLLWGMQRAEYYLQRSQLAHAAALDYVNLSHDAYRHFKELTDILALNGNTTAVGSDAEQSRQQLFASIDKVRSSIQSEIDHISNAGADTDGYDKHEALEMVQLDTTEGILHRAIWELERVRVLRSAGAERSAREMLTTALDETIDRQFKSKIDFGIAEELEEVTRAEQHAAGVMGSLRQAALATAALATIFALVMGWLLWRSLSTPIRRLMTGVSEVAGGNLEHHITLPGRNEFTYLANNFNQMTERLAQQHAQLLESQAGLERQVGERTRELKQANERLLALDEARRRFFADISHELRTPLTAIRGEAEVTLRGREKTTDEYRTALRRIIDLSAQLARLVEDLLFLARSETAGIRFEMRPVALDELVRTVCEEAGALARSKQLVLKAILPATTISVAGDPQRLRQLLLILIDNACRYSPAGGGAITLTLGADGGHATLTVADHGIGITTEEQTQVFQRHFRSERARRAVPSGTGLGLPLAKVITQAHQGLITLASLPDQGTTVTVTLPLLMNKE